MKTSKSKWAITSLTAIAFIFGLFFLVKAVEVKKHQPTKKFATTAWYSVSNPADPEVSGAPIPAPPVNDPNNCAQNNTEILCAVELEVPSEDYEFTSPQKLSSLPSGVTPTGNDAHRDE